MAQATAAKPPPMLDDTLVEVEYVEVAAMQVSISTVSRSPPRRQLRAPRAARCSRHAPAPPPCAASAHRPDPRPPPLPFSSQALGVNAADIQKLKAAGFHTVGQVSFAARTCAPMQQ